MLGIHGWIGRAIMTVAGFACLTNLAISQQPLPGRRIQPSHGMPARVQHAGGLAVTSGQPVAQRTGNAVTNGSVATGAIGVAQRTPVQVNDGSQVVPASDLFCDDATFCDTAECDTGTGLLSGLGVPTCNPVWAHFEYLMWWGADASIPALATTSPTGTPRDDAAVLGLGSTSVLFGEEEMDEHGLLNGGRLTLGLWIDPAQRTGIFGRGFALGEGETEFQRASDGSTILGRPFYNVFTDEPDALLLGFPNEFAGNIRIAHRTQTRGAEALLRRLYRQGGNYRLDFLAGYRYLGIDDELRIDNSLEFIDPASGGFGTVIDQFDAFDIRNEFHGGQLGLMGHSVDGRWALDFLVSVALGSMAQRATIQGATVTNPPVGNPVSVNGGLLTQQSNIGDFEDNPFTVIPEASVSLGYFITPRLDFSVGYTFLYVSRMLRAGDAVDMAVNLTQQTGQLQGAARPNPPVDDSDYWLQGLNFGLNFRY